MTSPIPSASGRCDDYRFGFGTQTLVPLSSVPGGQRRLADTSETSARPNKVRAKTAAKILFAIEFTSFPFYPALSRSLNERESNTCASLPLGIPSNGHLAPNCLQYRTLQKSTVTLAGLKKLRREKKTGI